MRVGSLCTGYGGIELGLTLAGEDVDLRWVAEIAPAKVLHSVPNLGDIKAVDWTTIEPVDLLTAGFPCQPVSAAGRQLGVADDRWLWPAVYDGIRDLRPARVLLENVRNLIAIHKGMPWRGILDDLRGLDYEVTWLTLGACRVGAAHHRHRVFVLATHTDAAYTRAAQRLDVPECGAKAPLILLPTLTASDMTGASSTTVREGADDLRTAVTLLPTPNAALGRSTGFPSVATATDRYAKGNRFLDDAIGLLPTPTARDGDGRGEDDPGYWEAKRRTNGIPLAAELALLPTPTVGDSRNSRNATASRSEGQSHHSGTTLSDVPLLLPTPSAVNYGSNQGGAAGRVGPVREGLETLGRRNQDWGRFEAAVARHAAIFGEPPPPTEPNRNGAPRLAAAFAEWLICLPAGHVTDHLERRDALAAIGNGVCPPQAAAAWLLLTGRADVLDMSLGQSVASAAMTSSTPLAAQAADIQQRHDAQRARVIAASASYFRSDGGQSEQAPEAHAAALVEAALMELAAVWREEAAWWESSGRRGAKGTAKEFTQAAARVAGFAIGLKSTRTEAAMVIVDDPHPPQCDCGRPTCAALYVGNATEEAWPLDQIDPVPVAQADVEVGHTLCSHPAEDMSKRRDGSIWCARCQQVVGHAMTTDEALPLVEQPHHLGDVPVQPAASPVSASPFASPVAEAPTGNPFTSPAKPTRSVNIARLGYAELGPLIAATYPLGARTYLSHSFVEDSETCGLKALLGDASRHGHVGPRRPSWALIGGTAFHAVVQGIETIALELGGQDPRGEFPDLPKVWESALDIAISDAATAAEGTPYVHNGTWHVSNKGLEGYDWWRVKGLDMLNLYLDRHDAAFRASHTLLRLPVIVDGVATSTAPALEFELTGAVGTIPVTNRLDAAWVAHPLPNTVNQYDTATVEIVDFKSGARDPMSSFQLVEYADILRRHYLPANFALPVVGRHYLARKGIYSDPVPLPADDATAAEIGYRYEMTRRKVAAGVFEPSPSSFCAGCGHVDRCPAQRSRDAS